MIHPRLIFLPQTLHRNNQEILLPLPFKTSQYVTSFHHLLLPLVQTTSSPCWTLQVVTLMVWLLQGSSPQSVLNTEPGKLVHVAPLPTTPGGLPFSQSEKIPSDALPPPTPSLISPASLPLSLLCSSCPGHLILPWTSLPEEFAVFPPPIAHVTSLTHSLPSSL